MSYTYQGSLVALSVFIAVFGSYTALRLASRVGSGSAQFRPYWIAGGACSMGIGIWGMHFVGMLAVDLPIPVAFDPSLTGLSVVPAILASAIALYLTGRNNVSPVANWSAAVLIGFGITTMHYGGMAAMQMTPSIVYNRPLVVVSVLIAVVASRAALHLASLERAHANLSFWRRLTGATVMGLAVAGMHFTGMAAAEFAPGSVCGVGANALTGSTVGQLVVAFVMLVLGGSLALTFVDEAVGQKAFYKTLLAAQSDAGEGVALLENERIIYANKAMETITGYSREGLLALITWRQFFDAPQTSTPAGFETRKQLDWSGRTEVLIVRNSGERITCDAVLTPFQHAGKTRQLLILFDITARRAAEEALRQREKEAQDLAVVASHTDNAVIITDARGFITWVNDGFEKITGYSRAEAMGQSPGHLLQGPETDPSERQRIREILARGEGFDAELVNYHKAGHKYWISIAVKPVRDSEGKAVKFVAIELDITQRKLTEAALLVSEAQARELAMVAARTDQGVMILDAQRHIRWVNDGFTRMTGYTLPELVGKMPGDVLHSDQTDPETVTKMREEFARGRSFQTDIIHSRKDGSVFWAAMDMQPIRDDSGNIVKYISMERDITDRKTANAELSLSESRLREVQAFAQLGYWENEIASDETRLSDEAQRIYEVQLTSGTCQRAELIARTHPEDREKLLQDRNDAVLKLGTYFTPLRLLFPDGRVKYVHLRGTVHADEFGKPVRISGTFQDVTEPTLLEKALRAREEEAKEMALFAAGTDNAVLVLDPSSQIIWVNEGFVKMSGYRADEVLGKRPSAMLNGPETDPVTLKLIREKLARNERFEAEIIHYRKGGEKYWAIIDIQAIFDSAGTVTKYISIERDITSRKLAEQELRRSEIRFKEAQQLAHIGSFEFDPSDNTCIVSDELLRIHEIATPGNRVARSVLMDRIHPQDMPRFLDARDEAMATQSGYTVQLRLLFANDRVKHIEMRGVIRIDEEGTLKATAGTTQDITELKLAEMALINANESLEGKVKERTLELETQRAFTETVLGTAENLIFVVDWRGRFVRFNGACERLTGYKFEELRDRPLWEFVITPERLDEARLKHENQKDPAKLTRNLEVEWMTRDGNRRLIAWTNAPLLDAEGKLEYMIGTGVDITERKANELALLQANQSLNLTISTLRETQTQLVQSEKMASLGGLVAGISHEINTPIGVGLTAATALQEEFITLQRDFETGTMKRSNLERFITQGLAGYDILVNNLLRAADLIRSFKQVAVDQSSDAWRKVDLHEYINEVLVSLQPRLKGRKIEVINAVPPNLVIHTHPGAIYQIVSNLLINSLIHAYEPEQTGRIEIAATRNGQEIQLVFSDDGKGIPEAIQKHIFDPFFTTRRGTGGSGLGLHIAFNLVASTLKGSIALTDTGGKGATFKIRFPIHKEVDQ